MNSIFLQQKKLGQRQINFYESSRPDVLSLALLVSPARKIESELLRRLRLELSDYFPADKKPTVGTESALWFSSLVESRGADSITLLPNVSDLLRSRFKDQHDELLEKIRPIILECHKKIPPIICWEEDLIYYSLSSADHSENLRDAILAAAKTIFVDERKGMEEWVNKMSVRVPANLLKHEDFKNLLSISQVKLVRPKPLKVSTETLPPSAEKFLQIKKGEGEIEIGNHLENADYQIGVPKTTHTTLTTWNSANPGDKQSHVIPPEEKVRLSFTPDDETLFLQTADSRIYRIPFDEPEISDEVPQEPEKPFTRPLNEAKMIVVGRGAVGKTSLVNRLIRDEFYGNEQKTQGIHIDKWEIELDDSEKVNVSIWDFGGQEIMYATHQFFLTERSLYLLILNGREGAEDAEAEYWLKLIDSFGGQSPVIIVLNKIAEHNFDINRGALQSKYPNIKSFVKTDLVDGIGIDELRREIKRAVNTLENLRVAFPFEWFAVKDRLSNMKENFLSFNKYRAICRENGVVNKPDQNTLARYLSELGIILFFEDDPHLRDTHILNPHWITEGIYKILNSPFLIERKGDIRLEEVSEILPEKDYPVSMHRFIFDLMKKFYLCFSYPDEDAHYLIPELLSKEKPQEAERFDPRKCLNFEYHYSILPEGILPRFIVRTNILSRDLPRWRSGVILEFEDCLALVKSDIVDRKILISVLGENYQSRRRLLAVIRSDFERIHNEIKNLEVDARVPLPDYPNESVSYDKLLAFEQSNKLKFPYVVNDEIIELDIRNLLSGVDLNKVTNRRENVGNIERESVRLFLSYSHKDEKFRSELETHLKILQRRGLITSWTDHQIEAGDEWKTEIDKNLESADIILFLISAYFVASDYSYEIEMKRAMERHDKGEAVVIPIILRDVNWKSAPFGKLQALPTNAKPVMKWENRDSAWRNVSEGIEKAAEKILLSEKRPIENESETDIQTEADELADKKILVYCSYSFQDYKFLREFKSSFNSVSKGYFPPNKVEVWIDEKMDWSSDYRKDSTEILENADVILLFVSPEYFMSMQCKKQMNIALELSKKKNTLILPIFLKPTDLMEVPLYRFQYFPREGSTIVESKNSREIWKKVSREIAETINLIASEDKSRINKKTLDDLQ